jgi:IS5 family transposase
MNSFRKQRTLAMMTGFERYTKKTRRAMFLEEMEQVVPWGKLCALIEPHYPKPGNGRRPKELEQMLRIYFLQQWFNLADPAVEEALYDSSTLRQFAGIDLGAEPVPDETTVCKFRHLLEENHLGEEILGTVNLHLQAKGVRITTGTIVDATLIHAPSSTKNREQSRDPEMQQAKKGKNWYLGMKAQWAWTARPRSSTQRWRRQPMFPMWPYCRTCCMAKKRGCGATERIRDKPG